MGHDRCPIFLSSHSFEEWLDPNLKNSEALLQILKTKKETLKFKTTIDRPLKAGWEKSK